MAAALPAQESRWIVEQASGWTGAEWSAQADNVVSPHEELAVRAMVARRVSGEPLQYILGTWAFRSLELFVDQRVLIPRPETEVVAGAAIEEARRHGAPIVVDLGTGSGAIALSVATEVETSRVYATDVSLDALAVARVNLAGIGRCATRVTLHKGSWFDALPTEIKGCVDVLVSNPPYVSRDDELPDDVRRWEPSVALFADDKGRSDLRFIVEHATAWLAPGGVLVLEMAPHQTLWATQHARAWRFTETQLTRDLAGRDRCLIARGVRN